MKTDMRQIAFTLIATALYAPVALAADAPEGAEGGLPQFDSRFFPGQIFWLVLSFGLLYILMARIALPRVARTQTNRHVVIAGEIEAARQANEAAQNAATLADKALSVARSNAQASVGEMMAAMQQEAAKSQAAQEKELSRKLRRAEEEIAVAREAALYTVSAGSVELGTVIATKILNARGG